MTFCRAFSLVLMVMCVPVAASAQLGGMPASPGAPNPPALPPPLPVCQEFLTLHGELQKHSQAISNARERKASNQEACGLFKSFLAAETKFITAARPNMKRIRRSTARPG